MLERWETGVKGRWGQGCMCSNCPVSGPNTSPVQSWAVVPCAVTDSSTVLELVACGIQFHNSWKALVHAPHPGISSLASTPHAPETAPRVVGVDSQILRERSLAVAHSHPTPAAAEGRHVGVLVPGRP